MDGVTAGLDVRDSSHYENVCGEACQIFLFLRHFQFGFFLVNVLLDCVFAWFYADRLGFSHVAFSLLRK